MKSILINKFVVLLFIWGVISLPFITGCDGSETQPDNLIQENTYIDILVELQLIRTHHNAMPDSIDADSLKQLVYEKYQIDEEQFVSSHQFYQKQVKEQLNRTDEAIKRLENEQRKIRAQIDSLQPDTAYTDTLSTDSVVIDFMDPDN